jgi:hypothetical protein
MLFKPFGQLIQETHELGIETAFWADTSLAQKAG